MGLLGLLTLPALGAPRMVLWLAGRIVGAAEEEFLDESRARGDLLNLQMRLELGEINEEEYAAQEGFLLERMRAIREAKAESSPR